jgi:hypothetical protein
MICAAKAGEQKEGADRLFPHVLTKWKNLMPDVERLLRSCPIVWQVNRLF